MSNPKRIGLKDDQGVRRLPERVARSSLPASENLHKTRRPANGSYVCFRRNNRTHAPQQSEATGLRLHVSPPSGRLECIGRLGDRPFLGNFHNSRQPDREGRATTGFALDRDVAAHHLAKASADHEAKASSAVFASRGCIGLGEFLEQFAHLLRRHADASVADRDGDPVAATFLPLSCVDGDGAVVGELVGVAHEVQQRLPQPHLVGMQRPDLSIT
jgi:hypothetical protein